MKSFEPGTIYLPMDRLIAINRKSVLTQEGFDRMLNWLSPADRERAGIKYESIRLNIIKNYARRGCTVAEELADEAINRVAEKLPEVVDSYVGDPALYFYGVANKVLQEYCRKRPESMPVPSPPSQDNVELVHYILDECLDMLPPDDRDLIREYFIDDKRAKIETRRKLAEKLGIPLNTLRTRAYRVKLALRDCITNRLKDS